MIYIGCAGFQQEKSKKFFPKGIRTSRPIEYYSSIFNSVELNSTFYGLPKPATMSKYKSKTPRSFKFSVKASRYITHIKRLKDPENTIPKFYNSVLQLEPKLSVILYQFPANFRLEEENFKNFKKTIEFVYNEYGNIRCAFEFRHSSWFVEEVRKFLGDRNIALVSSDMFNFSNWIQPIADFYYIRRHGKNGDMESKYQDKELKNMASNINSLPSKDVFIYFNNDAAGYAPFNAQRLKTYFKNGGPDRT